MDFLVGVKKPRSALCAVFAVILKTSLFLYINGYLQGLYVFPTF